MPLTKTGALRVHGPLSNRCAGSGMLLSSQGPQYLRSAAGNGRASGDLSSQSPSELLLSPDGGRESCPPRLAVKPHQD